MDLSPGQTFAERYRLEQGLGDGGYASVWQATDPEVGRRVAIKIIRHDEQGRYSSEMRERFRREAAAVANLQDPHTVTLFDYGESGGLLYLVFELVEGDSLGQRLRQQGTLDQRVAIGIVRQVLHSLREAHHARILHRDIKPDNIIVYEYMGDPNRAKLVDFGLAKPTAQGDTALTQPGVVMGTAHYVAPEAYRTQPVSPASDLFSLGMVFYEMFVGRPANTKQADMEIAIEQASDREFDIPDAVPEPLRAIVARMIAKNPRHRYQSADEVLDDLDSIPEVPGFSPERAPPASTPKTMPGRQFSAEHFGGQAPEASLQLDEEALAQRGARESTAPRPRNRIRPRKASGSVLKFGVFFTLLLVAASGGVIWYFDFEMPWNEVEPVDPATLSPKTFGIEAADTVTLYVDWSRGIVYADDPLTIPAPGRCAVILDSRSDPTPPGAFYVTNGLDGYRERVEAEPIGRDELARRAELCANAGEAAWYVQQSAEVAISEIRIKQAGKKKGARKIEVEQVRGKMGNNPYSGASAPGIKMPDVSKIPGVPR